jgi:hypothetical protein
MPCVNIDRCPIPLDEGVGPIYKKRFCKDNWDDCARFAVFSTLGPAHVPRWLRPNMRKEGEQIILRERQDNTGTA